MLADQVRQIGGPKRHGGAGNHRGEQPPAVNGMALIAAAHAGQIEVLDSRRFGGALVLEGIRPVVLRTKVGERGCGAGGRGVCGVAVVLNDDAVVSQVAQGVLDVAHHCRWVWSPVIPGQIQQPIPVRVVAG